jgi:diadenosine tetraphosphate (Ap4A) HIT family hydrolase
MAQYHHQAARSKEQLEEMKRLAKQGICIFCPENIVQDTEKIELQTENWMLKKNRYPYENTKHHLVLIPKQHVKDISELSKTAQEEFLPFVARVAKKYRLKSYAVAMRSGDMRYNGGSIEHIHAHLVVGDTDDPNHQPVRFKLSSRPD